MHRLLAAAALIAAPASAQTAAAPQTAVATEGAWRVDAATITLPAAKLTLPRTVGTASLVRTGEFSHPGQGLDNHAQYETPDGKLFATAYVYRATFPDAALAGYATERAIRQRFGATALPFARGAVPALGRPDGALRIVYEGGSYDGDPAVTGAAFARVDGWIVKLRVTGPAPRKAEVLAALDAMIAGLAVEKDAIVYAVRPLEMAAPCPVPADARPAKEVRKDATAQMLVGGLFNIAVATPDKKDEAPPFPANGATPVCVRGTMQVGRETAEVLQPAGTTSPDTILVALSDAGNVLAVQTSPLGGYGVAVHGIGEVRVGGTLDRLPTVDQLNRWAASRDRTPLTTRAITSLKADGNITTSIDSSVVK